jgi:CO/xanthine dehydrogenase FAD-binding subunit
MYHVVGYHRPDSLSEALRLLASSDRVALAGGVHLHHDGGAAPAELVDLQSAGLDTVTVGAESARLGATVRLQALADDQRLPEVIREAARSEQPSTLRSLATLGGAIATASGDSLLLAALLVHDAVIGLASEQLGERTVMLGDLLVEGRRPGELIIEVVVQTSGTGAIARTGRTPRDTPIVGVVGRRVPDRDGGSTKLALCGVGVRPALVEPGAVASVQSIDDHRATGAYRSHLAEVLTGRVLETLS